MKVGDPTVTIRLPSLVCGTAAVPVIFLLGERIRDRATGMVAAALTALSPFAVYFATEARPYATLIFLLATSTLRAPARVGHPVDAVVGSLLGGCRRRAPDSLHGVAGDRGSGGLGVLGIPGAGPRAARGAPGDRGHRGPLGAIPNPPARRGPGPRLHWLDLPAEPGVVRPRDGAAGPGLRAVRARGGSRNSRPVAVRRRRRLRPRGPRVADVGPGRHPRSRLLAQAPTGRRPGARGPGWRARLQPAGRRPLHHTPTARVVPRGCNPSRSPADDDPAPARHRGDGGRPRGARDRPRTRVRPRPQQTAAQAGRTVHRRPGDAGRPGG